MKNKRKRKSYDPATGKIKTEGALKPKSGHQTTYWENITNYEQVRLYIKKRDNGKPIKQHCIRLEVTLSRGGCQNADVYRLGMIPHFVPRLRKYLTPFMCMAKGIKPNLKRTRTINADKLKLAERAKEKASEKAERGWRKYGAAWAVLKGHTVTADTDTNRLIGKALKNFRESLIMLTAPEKVADYDAWLKVQLERYKGLSVALPPHSIEVIKDPSLIKVLDEARVKYSKFSKTTKTKR